MINLELLVSKYEAGQLDAIAESLKLLHDLGVFIAQVMENKQSIINSFEHEDPAELAKRILEVRQTNRTLLALHELGASMKEGIKNAQS